MLPPTQAATRSSLPQPGCPLPRRLGEQPKKATHPGLGNVDEGMRRRELRKEEHKRQEQGSRVAKERGVREWWS
ncbi:hypothetical protein OPV22_027251 [Ensete ventricosum]|uniref:Uncharacterized protein n=1 Tax=Ensete ventricosum TaxID=4639 RepID=A0AAV8PZJ5_ENSVE|nr:hypothetical protein OPV22_027251 [Ensete ventricosum]